MRLVTFTIMTLLVIVMLTILMIPTSHLSSGGVASLISLTLFIAYLVYIDMLRKRKKLKIDGLK